MSRWLGAIIVAAVVVLLGVGIWLGSRSLWLPGPPPDPLALELRRFRKTTDEQERIDAIQRFGHVRDPRVAVALMEVTKEELAKDRSGGPLLVLASGTLVHYHIPKDEWATTKYWNIALWWEKNEAEVRRQAAALPQ